MRFCFVVFVLVGFQVHAQKERVNDSIEIEFIYSQPKYPDSLILHAPNGWYKAPLAARTHEILSGYQYIIPAQQNLDRLLTVTAFTHDMNLSADYTYPVVYREMPFEMEDTTINADGIIDGVVRMVDTVAKDFEKDHPQVFDSVRKAQEAYRNLQMQPTVTELLQPFYFSKTEVTNNEYRQFVNWVRDSIARRMVYLGYASDAEAVKWLNIDKKEATKIDLSRREANLAKYGFNYNWKLDQEDDSIIELTKNMYYPQPERFYKRREIDVSKLRYQLGNGQSLAVYPDTLSMLEGKNFYDPVMYMYFWHPAYDNYPVLGLTYAQASAYCAWYQRQMNAVLAKDNQRAVVSIPSLYQYEMAAKSNQPKLAKFQVENLPNDAYHVQKRRLNGNEYCFLRKVSWNEFPEIHYTPGNGREDQVLLKYNDWLKVNRTFPIYFLNGNASEFCSTPISAQMVQYYKLDIASANPENQALVLGSNYREDVVDISGNQRNAVFYKRIVPKDKSGAAQGFRTVIRIYEL